MVVCARLRRRFQALDSRRRVFRAGILLRPRHWRDESDFDCCLIEPAAVDGSVVQRKALPDLVAQLSTISVGQRFAILSSFGTFEEPSRGVMGDPLGGRV
jgi:hypothetical protein